MSRLVHPVSPKLRKQAVRGHQEGVRLSICRRVHFLQGAQAGLYLVFLLPQFPKDSPSPAPWELERAQAVYLRVQWRRAVVELMETGKIGPIQGHTRVPQQG